MLMGMVTKINLPNGIMEQCDPPFVYHPNTCSHSLQYSSEREKTRTRSKTIELCAEDEGKVYHVQIRSILFGARDGDTHTSDLFALHPGPPSMLGLSQFQANGVGSYYT